jgi:hypothetical protein
MDKEIDRSRSRSRRSYYNKRREVMSFDRHHHNPPRNSFRKSCTSSIPYRIKKHKRRIRVDELQGEMNNINLNTFDGEKNKDEYAKN